MDKNNKNHLNETMLHLLRKKLEKLVDIPAVAMLLYFRVQIYISKVGYIWVFPKIGFFTPQIIHLFIGFSSIFTIHFGGFSPLFLEIPKLFC